MNKQNRKELRGAIDLINKAVEIISAVKEEEEEKYYNLPDGLQESEKGEAFQENINTLDDAISDIEGIVEYIDEIIN